MQSSSITSDILSNLSNSSSTDLIDSYQYSIASSHNESIEHDSDVSNSIPVFHLSTHMYHASRDDELGFKPNQLIRILRKDEGEEWLEGFYGNRVGWFPSRGWTVPYTEYIPDVQDWMSVSQDTLDYYRVQTMLMNADVLDKTDLDIHYQSQVISIALSVQEKLETRSLKVLEFVEYETDFVQDLQHCINEYRNPESIDYLLDTFEHESLIEMMDDIINFHRVLCSSMHIVSQATPKQQLIGGYFLDFIPFFLDVYLKYKMYLPKIMTLVVSFNAYYNSNSNYSNNKSQIRQNDNREKNPTLLFMAGIHKPTQHISKLLLFLRKIVQVTPLDHDDFDSTILAWRSFREAISKIESKVKQTECKENLKQIMKRIDVWQGPSLENYGLVLHSGQLKIGNKKHWHQFYLLERMLIVLKPKNTSSLMVNRYSSSIVEAQVKFKVAYKIAYPHSRLHSIITNELSDETYFRIMYLNSQDHMENIDCFCLNKEIKTKWVEYLQNWAPELEYSVGPTVPAKDYPVAKPEKSELNYDDVFGKSTLRIKRAFSSLNPMEWRKKSSSQNTCPTTSHDTSLSRESRESREPEPSFDQYFHNQKQQRDIVLANMTCTSLESIPESLEEEEFVTLESSHVNHIDSREKQVGDPLQSFKEEAVKSKSNHMDLLPTPRSDSLDLTRTSPSLSPSPLSNSILPSDTPKEMDSDSLGSQEPQECVNEKELPEVPDWIDSLEYEILLKKYEQVALEASQLRLRLQELTELEPEI